MYSGRNPPEFLEFHGIPGFRPESVEEWKVLNNQWKMCMSKVQHMAGRKTGFFRFFHFLTNLATGDQKFSEFVQLQPVVWSFAAWFSSVLVFFQSSKLDLRTLPLWYTLFMGGGLVFIGRLIQLVEHPCLTLWV